MHFSLFKFGVENYLVVLIFFYFVIRLGFNRNLLLLYGGILFSTMLSYIINNRFSDLSSLNALFAINISIGFYQLRITKMDSAGIFKYLVPLFYFLLLVALYSSFHHYLTSDLLANEMFHGNPNSSVLFLISMLILLDFIPVPHKVSIRFLLILIIFSTISRMGIMVGLAFLLRDVLREISFLKVIKSSIVILVFGFLVSSFFAELVESIAFRLSPENVLKLSTTMEVEGGRDFIWEESLNLINGNILYIFFGTGPAALTKITGRGTHSSYISVIGNYGYIVMFLLLIYFIFQFRSSRKGIFLLFITLLAASTEEFMFIDFSPILCSLFLFLALENSHGKEIRV